MYVFNKIVVNPQLPKRINRLGEIANNLWWSWNTDFLRLFKKIDIDLWDQVEKNPVKFMKLVSQEKLEAASSDPAFLQSYDKLVENFDGYINSDSTWFSRNYPDNKEDLVAYFSAEYGLDQILSIYSGGLGVLSGDHLKTASDLGLPLVGVGLLYKEGFCHQYIGPFGEQQNIYNNLDIDSLPIERVKDENGDDLMVFVKFPKRRLYLKVWQVNVGRIKLYLLDSDIDENTEEYRNVTKQLYGGDQEMRISQEIVLGMGGVSVLRHLGLEPKLYHMNEGHSSFLLLELMKNIMKDKEVSFNVARDIVTSQTVFTTHTPIPAGNDIFPKELVLKYFKDYWVRLGITEEEFLNLGTKNNNINDGFNMGVLALKIAGKKNGVSKLHGAVSRTLFAEVWPNIAPDESPITYVTNGIHTCSWLPQDTKDLYNKYLAPYWQDSIHLDKTWEKIKDIPAKDLWEAHLARKEKFAEVAKKNMIERFRRNNMNYKDIDEIVPKFDPNALTIGFGRRFISYKRATLIFRDIERITEILNKEGKPVQLVFAGKAHPRDIEGQNIMKYIHELSMKPQFKGKVFLLENYSLALSRYMIAGVDVWLNTPRRPMEASGTSGQKASVNGVINFSVLDGWWAEGYNQKNGWAIGTNAEYESYEAQDDYDSQSIYNTLENKIVPLYYDRDKNGIPEGWVDMMKNSIISTGGKYSTSRMLVDYISELYIPLINLNKKYYEDLSNVTEYEDWKSGIYNEWDKIEIIEEGNTEDLNIDAGNNIEVNCTVKLPNISKDHVEVQVYYGKIKDNGMIEKIAVIPMKEIAADEEEREMKYTAKIELTSGGDYGYTFRVMPKHEMLLDSANLDLIKWITK